MLKLLLSLLIFSPMCLMADQWVIIANSPDFSVENVQRYFPHKKIVALDGAANHLKEHSLIPHIILGDFDSIQDKAYWGIIQEFDEIDESSLAYAGHFGVMIIPAKNQDLTDLEKGILFCDSQEAKSIVILNATGGRFDHTLGNIGFLKKYHKVQRPLAIISGDEHIQFVRDDTVKIRGDVGSVCGIIGFPEATMTSSGLKYNGEDYLLKLGFQESICNTLAFPNATISIQGEALVIHKISYD